MVLNGEKKEFDITFEINEGVGYWDIESTLGDSYLFSVWYDTIPPNSYVDFIARYFNENNFIIFPGIDGINYLIVQDYSLPLHSRQVQVWMHSHRRPYNGNS